MNKNKRHNKVFEIIENFIMSPLGYFSNTYGKIVISISIVCICLFITRPMTKEFKLPKEAQDIVGNIPIIEHMDDGHVEYTNNNRSVYYPDSYVRAGEKAAMVLTFDSIPIRWD